MYIYIYILHTLRAAKRQTKIKNKCPRTTTPKRKRGSQLKCRCWFRGSV